METIIESALDWQQDPDVLDARKRLNDATAIHEERDRERQLLWDHKFSDDPFLRARYRGEWQRADEAAAQAEGYVHQARTRRDAAEQAARARSQPLWDEKFCQAWTAIETVLTGPLLQSIQAWETLTAEAGAKGMIVPALLPANLATESMDTWISWVKSQLGLIDR